MLTLFSSILPACAKYESPEYTVVRKQGAFEIRDYPSLTMVSTAMQHRGSDGAFMKLFRYISGRNEQIQKISMTTPVLMTGTESGTMSFVVPKEVARKGAPAPSNPDVSLHEFPAARYAVYRFSGSSKPGPSEKAASKLLAWTASEHLNTKGSPLFACYNPPWTPGFMRRNEVLIQLSPDHP
jgi:effector-binding domain-containing protein